MFSIVTGSSSPSAEAVKAIVRVFLEVVASQKAGTLCRHGTSCWFPHKCWFRHDEPLLSPFPQPQTTWPPTIPLQDRDGHRWAKGLDDPRAATPGLSSTPSPWKPTPQYAPSTHEHSTNEYAPGSAPLPWAPTLRRAPREFVLTSLSIPIRVRVPRGAEYLFEDQPLRNRPQALAEHQVLAASEDLQRPQD